MNEMPKWKISKLFIVRHYAKLIGRYEYKTPCLKKFSNFHVHTEQIVLLWENKEEVSNILTLSSHSLGAFLVGKSGIIISKTLLLRRFLCSFPKKKKKSNISLVIYHKIVTKQSRSNKKLEISSDFLKKQPNPKCWLSEVETYLWIFAIKLLL